MKMLKLRRHHERSAQWDADDDCVKGFGVAIKLGKSYKAPYVFLSMLSARISQCPKPRPLGTMMSMSFEMRKCHNVWD